MPVEPDKYSRLTDSHVFSAIFEAGFDADHPLHQLALPFVARRHLRLAKELVLADNALPGTANGRRSPDRKRLDKLEEAVRIKFGKYALVDVPLHSATKMDRPENRILVLIDGQTRYLDDISELVRGMPADIWRARVYAPKEYRDTVKKFCEEWLTQNPVSSNQDDGRKDSA